MKKAAFTILGFVALAGAAAASAGADLVVSNVTASQASALAGEQIAVGCSVDNTGLLAAGPSRLKYYWSADASLDASDTYLNYDAVGALSAGASEAETANVRVPQGTPDGAYFVLFVADYDAQVGEVDEQNNVFALPITVGTPVDGPDLTVSDVSLPSHADPDEVIAASAVVHNIGNQPSGETRLKYYLSSDASYDSGDTYLNYDVVAPLVAGGSSPESANLRIPAGTPDGVYQVLFVADQTAVVTEPDESNNVHASPLVVGQPLPDLRLQAVSVPHPEVRAGETIAVSATVVNQGHADAAAARLVYYLSTDTVRDPSDKQLSYDSFGPLAVGAQSPEDAALRVSSATLGGNYYLLLSLDADEVVAESDESDNLHAVPIVVTTDDPTAILPDLTLSNALLGADTVAAGGTLAASVTVGNGGVAPAGESRLKYYLSADVGYDESDTYLNYDNIAPLAVGETSPQEANLTIPNLPHGDYFVLFVADAVRDVAEQYESNNVVALSFSVGDPAGGPGDDPDAPLADLMVTSGSLGSLEVMAGERASLFCRVENVGSYAATATSRVKYYLSADEIFDAGDDYVGYDNVPALAPGATSDEDATPLIPALTQHGRWYLLLVADAAGEVAETFESNNVLSVPFDVVVDNPSLDAADVYADSVVLDKAVVGAGYKLDVDFTVHNDGTQPAHAPRVKLYLSADTRHDAGDDYLAYRQLGDVAVGASVAVTADVRIPADAVDGSAHLLVMVDSEHAVEETYESNNLLAVSITIGADSGPNQSYPYSCPSTVFTDPSLLEKHTVASFNALHLGWQNGKDLPALACVVSHFDLVGLIEIFDPQGVADLIAELELLTGQAWSAHVSEYAVGNENGVEFYAYVWRDAEVSLIAPRGFFDDSQDVIKRDPYGADFRMGSFDFTFVLFHLQYGQTLATRRFEASHLVDVYQYFQAQNGAENDVLIGGDFNLPGNDPAFTLLDVDGIRFITDPEQATSVSTVGLANSFDNIFYNDGVSELIGSGAHDYTNANWSVVRQSVSDHIPVWAAFDTSSDDD